MDYVNLGKTGLKVSRICLGMMSYGNPAWREWVLDYDTGLPIVRLAAENGVNFFDTADMYSKGESEVFTGRMLKEIFPNRDEYVVASKVFFSWGDQPNMGGLSRKHIMSAIDGTLQRLNLDYVDLYQIHRWDYETPIEETMEALHDVVKAGKARYIGASSMWTWQFAKAQYTADLNGWTRFISMQNHYNLISREEEREMIPFCLDQNVGLIPWSPLARGFLAGTRTRDKSKDTLRGSSDSIAHNLYYSDADFDTVDRLKEVAERYDCKPAQLALAWLLHKPGVTSPIIGATKAYQVEEALSALSIQISAEDMAYLEALYQPKTITEFR